MAFHTGTNFTMFYAEFSRLMILFLLSRLKIRLKFYNVFVHYTQIIIFQKQGNYDIGLKQDKIYKNLMNFKNSELRNKNGHYQSQFLDKEDMIIPLTNIISRVLAAAHSPNFFNDFYKIQSVTFNVKFSQLHFSCRLKLLETYINDRILKANLS